MAEIRPTSEELEDFGNTLAELKFGVATLSTALLAIQVFMVLYGLGAFFGAPKNAREGRLPFIIISLVILATSSIDAILGVWESYRFLRIGGPTGISYIQAEAVARKYWQDFPTLSTVGDAMLSIAIVVGDGLMLWRCFILWSNKRWIVLIPSLTFIGTIVSTGMSLATDWYKSSWVNKAVIASACLSVATNVLTTGFILLRLTMAWIHQRKAFPDRMSPRLYSNVTAILIESATPLAIFGISFIVILINILYNRPPTLPQRVRLIVLDKIFNCLYYSFCALSPQMIIFRITTGKSWKNAAETQDGTARFSQPIQFAQDAMKETRASDSIDDVERSEDVREDRRF